LNKLVGIIKSTHLKNQLMKMKFVKLLNYPHKILLNFLKKHVLKFKKINFSSIFFFKNLNFLRKKESVQIKKKNLKNNSLNKTKNNWFALENLITLEIQKILYQFHFKLLISNTISSLDQAIQLNFIGRYWIQKLQKFLLLLQFKNLLISNGKNWNLSDKVNFL
jgi:hypothetical protein